MFWSAILLGLGGGLHCVGMCGPLVMAVPATPHVWLGRLLYHAGRILTYATLGALMGGLGQLISFVTGQEYLSVIMGVIMLLTVVVPSALRNKLSAKNPMFKLSQKIRKWFGVWFKQRSYAAVMVLGMLNGLLVCGLVYGALAIATATGSALKGAAVMAVFGLSTMPMLLGVLELISWIPTAWRAYVQRFSTVVTMLVAVVLIMRGLHLGVPLSPAVQVQSGTDGKVTCSHR